MTSFLDTYRRTGADLPFGDPLPWHGVSMEGYFWRFSDPASGRVIITLVGINSPARGDRWATVGIAAEPSGHLATAELAGAWADPQRLGVRVGDDGGEGHVVADARRLDAVVGASAVHVSVESPRPWPHRRFGGSSLFQSVPGLNQYWHPWLLGGTARGHAVVDGERVDVDGWQVYGEKNWGRGGFPDAWWWGQAQGFAERDTCVAFAGGQVTAGPTVLGRRLTTEVTALVVALPDGRVLRLGNPGASPVRTEARPGHWQLRGRSRRWQVEVDASIDPGQAFVLPVPLVEERRNAPGALESLVGHIEVRVAEHGREVWRGESQLAGLELGGRALAEEELATRGGSPSPTTAQ